MMFISRFLWVQQSQQIATLDQTVKQSPHLTVPSIYLPYRVLFKLCRDTSVHFTTNVFLDDYISNLGYVLHDSVIESVKIIMTAHCTRSRVGLSEHHGSECGYFGNTWQCSCVHHNAIIRPRVINHVVQPIGGDQCANPAWNCSWMFSTIGYSVWY